MGTLQLRPDARGRRRNWIIWFLEDISFDALLDKGYIKKMHHRSAKAFGKAHEIVCENFLKGRQIVAPNGYVRDNEERKEAALLLLANGFCRQLRLTGFPDRAVSEAEKTLLKPSRHEPPLDMSPTAVAVRTEALAINRSYTILLGILLHAVLKLDLPI